MAGNCAPSVQDIVVPAGCPRIVLRGTQKGVSQCYLSSLPSTSDVFVGRWQTPPAGAPEGRPSSHDATRAGAAATALVADTDPLEIVYEDEAFLVVSKPQFVKMHPAHRFEGGTLVNRVIGYLNYNAHAAHR
jgi:23S rRNA-/tRNA-specific pseudouridylate synthase